MTLNRGQAIKAAGAMTIVSLLSKVFGFLREMALAREFGATFETDAFLIAIMIPQILFASLGASIATTFIPLYTEARLDNKHEVNSFVSTFFKIMVGLSSIIVTVALLFTPQLISVISPGFTGEVRELSILLTRIMLPVIVFLAAGGVLKGILHSHNEFLIPVSVGVFQNVIIIAFILILGPTYGIEMVTVGSLIGFSMNFFILYPKARKLKVPLIDKLKPFHPLVKRSFYLMLPILFGNMVLQLNKLVDRMLASNLEEGSISALNYASKIFTLPHGIFVMAVATVLYPSFSQFAAKGNVNRVKETMVSGLSSLVFLILPMMIGALVLREPIIRVLFERGEFDATATERTAFALFFYSLGMLSISLREIINRVFYSYQDTKTPIRIATISVFINIGLNFLLVGPLGHGGLAFATSISMTIGVVLLFISVRRFLGPFGLRSFTVNGLKMLLAAGTMGTILYGVNLILPEGTAAIWRLVIPTIFGGSAYLAICRALQVEEMDIAKDMLIKALNRFRK
ncbi:murein biosynthesis integral membrane protein MurJ [Natranaerobius thermophilus]|uniref:Probable lipid II flippase MurJ n=1 Tax=Natranaerobius thermophilus (strain ATCC BAA-1301 / DSM 18059 / JW/NM-WN-LF) TaxID=457570 RepID=B2A0P0_NATTJ|nr:murein biosynthesis integral membrane protein MurJ [Natranaerobius thermophilus]ACB85920.1 integral membrane protein MviN [Natranaerobius thermophilus JW/NM-WN-LF]